MCTLSLILLPFLAYNLFISFISSVNLCVGTADSMNRKDGSYFETNFTHILTNAGMFTPRNWQYLCVLCGPLCALLFGLSLIVSGNFPPIPPSWGAERVKDHYFNHELGTRAGAAIMLFSSGLWLPYGAVLSKQMQRIEKIDPILCDLQLASCAAGAVTLSYQQRS